MAFKDEIMERRVADLDPDSWIRVEAVSEEWAREFLGLPGDYPCYLDSRCNQTGRKIWKLPARNR
jgi:hypothetical protein